MQTMQYKIGTTGQHKDTHAETKKSLKKRGQNIVSPRLLQRYLPLYDKISFKMQLVLC